MQEGNKEILKLTKGLMRFRSTKDEKKELSKIVDFCIDYFEKDTDQGRLFVERFERNDKPSVVITTKETRSPEYLLNGHLDVVEADGHMFEPRVEDGKIYGRGSYDMKGVDAVMIVLLKELASLDNALDIGLMLTTDEEVGGFDGVDYLFKEEGYSTKCVFVPDGGKNFRLTTEAKGVIHLVLKTKGRAAHGSRPWLGENAIEKLLLLIAKIREEFPNPKSEKDWVTSLNVGWIKGGDTTNKVADWAEAGIDIRYPSQKSASGILREIEDTVGEDGEVTVGITGPAFSSDPNNDYVQRYKKVAEQVLGRELEFNRQAGASDVRHLMPYRPAVILTQAKGGDAHGDKEWVDIDSMLHMYEILYKFLT